MPLQIKFNLTTIVLGLALIAVVTYFLKQRCNKPQPSSYAAVVDSLLGERQKSDSVFFSILKRKQDSIVRAKFVIDSIGKITNKTTRALEVSKAKIALLIAKSYANASDTTKCCQREDSLRRENIFLLENVNDYQRAQEVLVSANKLLIKKQDSIIIIKDSLYAGLKGDFNFLANKYSKLDYNYQQISRKGNKRFGIGLQGGYTYLTDKIKPIVSVGIHYSIIRF